MGINHPQEGSKKDRNKKNGQQLLHFRKYWYHCCDTKFAEVKIQTMRGKNSNKLWFVARIHLIYIVEHQISTQNHKNGYNHQHLQTSNATNWDEPDIAFTWRYPTRNWTVLFPSSPLDRVEYFKWINTDKWSKTKTIVESTVFLSLRLGWKNMCLKWHLSKLQYSQHAYKQTNGNYIQIRRGNIFPHSHFSTLPDFCSASSPLQKN